MTRLIIFIAALIPAIFMSLASHCAETAFSHVWGGFSTSFAGRSEQQRHNTNLAIREMDGLIIAPGSVFSFNSRVGARDRGKGYTAAPMISGSGILEDIPGGGICQLATTIYNAGLLAGLQVVERHPHSRAVGYVPPGRDATVSSWRKDLKLRNPFPQPVMLRISGDGERLDASFRSVVEKGFQVEILSEKSGVEPDTVAVNGAVAQQGAPGFSSITRRIIRKEGGETFEIISEDFYPAPTRIVGGGR